MSERDFPTLTPTGQLPKLDSIFDVSAKFLGELRLWFEMNPPAVSIDNILGFPVQQRFLDRSGATVDVVSSVTETSVYSGTVPAGQMGTNRAVRLTMGGDLLYNNNVTNTLRFRVKFGGTTFFDYTTTTVNAALSATRRAWLWEILVVNLGTTNSQFITSRFSMGVTGSVSTATTGIGDYGEVFRLTAINAGGATGIGAAATLGALDTTVDQAVVASVQWSASAVTNSFRRRLAMLELI